jgi:hypothetical protein
MERYQKAAPGWRKTHAFVPYDSVTLGHYSIGFSFCVEMVKSLVTCALKLLKLMSTFALRFRSICVSPSDLLNTHVTVENELT